MSKSWSKSFKWSGRVYTYGFIDDSGHGDRYFLTVDDVVAEIKVANAIVPLLAEIYGSPHTTPKITNPTLNKRVGDEG